MKLTIKYKNGSSETLDVEKLGHYSKNPCASCRKDGGCYEHGCFMPEEWGDFLDLGHHHIRVQDVESMHVSEM